MTEETRKTIQEAIEKNRVMLFMKGTPQSPQCGFSAQVVKVLESYQVPFEAADILADWELREGIKEFSNWPTIPQLYIDGEFIGGCDITMELHRKGELKSMLKG